MRPRCLMFNYLQSRIRGTASNGPGAPPDGLVRFYWHFVSQTKRWYGAMFVTSLAVALIDTVIPVFIGKLVSLMEATNRQAAIAREWPILAGMVALVLLVRPLLILIDIAIRQNALIPGATSLIRWQSHWHVVRQRWTFFQNDFAGRIATRVVQTANALRESVMNVGGISNFIGQAPTLWNELAGSFNTNMTMDEILRLGSLVQEIPRENIHFGQIDNLYVDLATTN